MRSIHTRLEKLEMIKAAQPVNCPGCGYPERLVIRVVCTDHDDPMPTCKVCGRHLDEDGMPLPNHYKRYIRGKW